MLVWFNLRDISGHEIDVLLFPVSNEFCPNVRPCSKYGLSSVCILFIDLQLHKLDFPTWAIIFIFTLYIICRIQHIYCSLRTQDGMIVSVGCLCHAAWDLVALMILLFGQLPRRICRASSKSRASKASRSID